MKKRVDKPVEMLVGDEPPPILDVEEDMLNPFQGVPLEPSSEERLDSALKRLAKEAAAYVKARGFDQRAIVCRRNVGVTEAFNWGIIVTVIEVPINKEIKPIGVRWPWRNGVSANKVDFERPEDLVIIHPALSPAQLITKISPFDIDEEASM